MASTQPKPAAKIVAVGDGYVGKTCMLCSYAHRHFPHTYIPTVFDVFNDNIEVDGVSFSTTLWDTAGQENYDKLRLLTYSNTQCFLLCFSIGSRASYENITKKWIKELKHYCPDVPVILVGTKSDLRNAAPQHTTQREGRQLKALIKAVDYVECSAKEMDNLDAVFIAAIKAIYGLNKPRTDCCSIL